MKPRGRVLSCGERHSEAEIISAYKSIIGSRQTPHAGPGRPRADQVKPSRKPPSKAPVLRGRR